MKTSQKQKDSLLSSVEIDPSLNKYRTNTPFPEKLAMAKKALRTAKLPERTHHNQSEQPSHL